MTVQLVIGGDLLIKNTFLHWTPTPSGAARRCSSTPSLRDLEVGLDAACCNAASGVHTGNRKNSISSVISNSTSSGSHSAAIDSDGETSETSQRSCGDSLVSNPSPKKQSRSPTGFSAPRTRTRTTALFAVSAPGCSEPSAPSASTDAWPAAQTLGASMPTQLVLLTAEIARLKKENVVLRQAAGPQVAMEASAVKPSSTRNRTSIMLRNIPNCYTRGMFMDLLNDRGFAGMYDFVHIPVDHSTRMNRGYGFVNLTNTETAKMFWTAFHGFTKWVLPTRKVCGLTWCDRQGLTENMTYYQAMTHEHDEFKPHVCIDGVFQPFPKSP